MTQLPLVDRPAEAVIAHCDGRAVTVAEFLAQASALADRLPARRYAINLCGDRYQFFVSFAAVMLARQTSLLPPNRLAATIVELRAEHPDAYVLNDDDAVYDGGEHFDPRPLPAGERLASTATIDADHPAAIVFTSGSTGGSKALAKPWGTLLSGARINVAEMGLADGHARHLVATVPPQHMYGLETSILAPCVAPVAASAARPFTPLDIHDALAAVPAPRLLVSTPVHLRAIHDSGGELPALERIFSATAPLDVALARALEDEYATTLSEIYGCSETGSLARRRTSQDEHWRLFDGFELRVEGERGEVAADHLPEPIVLQDRIELHGRYLRLLGRAEDLVNIAGKRASLNDLTRRLQGIPGVMDGVIFEPPVTGTGPVERLAALVVAPRLDASTLRRELLARIDEAFVPRPIRWVEALPRSETGKLARAAIMEAFESGHEGSVGDRRM
ncbi:MAG: AMP-binding protein, partial [Halofilum sp. (in: g-proteobacteria)]